MVVKETLPREGTGVGGRGVGGGGWRGLASQMEEEEHHFFHSCKSVCASSAVRTARPRVAPGPPSACQASSTLNGRQPTLTQDSAGFHTNHEGPHECSGSQSGGWAPLFELCSN